VAATAAAKPLPFVRPADIYKRMDEEKEKERLSMDSSRPSMDSVLGRTEATSSVGQLRSSHEQGRRTSFENHEGSESSRGRKSTLAPVAERKSEYGMEGLLAKAQPDHLPISPQLDHPRSELSPSESEFGDNVKQDLLKARRFSTSPQLPNLTRVSGFGVDFFSNASNFSSTTSLSLPTPSSEPLQLSMETSGHPARAGTTDQAGEQHSSAVGNLDPTPKQDASLATTDEKADTSKFDRRPELPGGWVSESTTVPPTSEQPTPLETGHVQDATLPTMVNNNTITLDGIEQIDRKSLTQNGTLRPPADASEIARPAEAANQPHATDRDKVVRHPDGQHTDAGAVGTPRALTTEGHMPAPPSSQSAKSEDQNLQPHTSASQPPIATDDLQYTSPAPLNPSRADSEQQEISLPSIRQRHPTVSTVDTISPEKDLESDKLREEIIKSLSPAPTSPAASDSLIQGDGSKEPVPGNLTRESTYLAGVYDDYLSPTEDKSLQEVSQEAKMSTHMIPSQVAEPENANAVADASGPALNDLSISQPVAHDSAKSHTLGDVSRPRRFSWQQSADEEILSPAEPKPTMIVYPQDSPHYSQRVFTTPADIKSTVVSPNSDSLHAEGGGAGTISHQVSQVSSRAPGDASLSAIEPPSPISLVAAKSPQLASDGPNTSSLSLADEKEKVLIGDAQSTASSIAEQHPALARETHSHGVSVSEVAPVEHSSHAEPAPATFREILNLGSCEQRINKFDETRERFYVMDSGLSSWLIHLQEEPEHNNAAARSSAQVFTPRPGTQTGPSGSPFAASKMGGLGSQPRRTSMGNVQQLMAGQSGSNFNASGNQMGTKSKEFLHAAGAFGNKGVKSGMKLFNKGKSKLRERTGGDKTFF